MSACEWISLRSALAHFVEFRGSTQSQRHIKPLHWYVACRLVVEGGFDPDEVMPRPPFRVDRHKGRPVLVHDPGLGGSGERTVYGGLKTKEVDVVVTKEGIGPVLAVSCKGAIGAFRNLTNRMEEAVGECTNLHIAYPPLVCGYVVVMRANRAEEVGVVPDQPQPEQTLRVRHVVRVGVLRLIQQPLDLASQLLAQRPRTVVADAVALVRVRVHLRPVHAHRPNTQQLQFLRQQQYLQERLRYRFEVAAPERADRVVVRMTVRRHVPNANVPIRRPLDPTRAEDPVRVAVHQQRQHHPRVILRRSGAPFVHLEPLQRPQAIDSQGRPVALARRFHAALCELADRRGIRDDVSRYEAIALALASTRPENVGSIVEEFPDPGSPLRFERFFETLYRQYDERFVYGAPDLRRTTGRKEWASTSAAFSAAVMTSVDYEPRIDE